MNKYVSIFFVALVVIAAAVGIAKAASFPQWVANDAGVGKMAVWNSSLGDFRIAILEITATTDDVSFSAYKYDPNNGWVRVAPTFGFAATDTVITVPAGQTKGYTFPTRIDVIVQSVGTGAYWSGE